MSEAGGSQVPASWTRTTQGLGSRNVGRKVIVFRGRERLSGGRDTGEENLCFPAKGICSLLLGVCQPVLLESEFAKRVRLCSISPRSNSDSWSVSTSVV